MSDQAERLRYVFILHSPTFWEVLPPTKAGMRKLGEYIQMVRMVRDYYRRKRECSE